MGKSLETGRAKYALALRDLRGATLELLDYCGARGWAGYDPYDALNSRVFSRTPFARSRVCRIAFTQMMKRLPLNFRPLLAVPRERNPKGDALFLKAFLKLDRGELLSDKKLIGATVDAIVAFRSPDSRYWCWGYSFPWQGRSVIVAKGAPNLVCTTFVAGALLDAYESVGEPCLFEMAHSAARYILKELYWTGTGDVAGYSYPSPTLHVQVHNANFLGAELLARVYQHCGDKELLDSALKVARCSAARQHDDGSWDYGELPTQRWIDNFHTGFNLCALRSLGRQVGSEEFEPSVHRGHTFFLRHFFRQDGAPKYYHDRVYPIDIHSAAQSILTLVTLRDLDQENLERANAVAAWTMREMRDREGFFYFQCRRCWKIRVPYMRWSQAWMLSALATLLEQRAGKGHDHGAGR